MSQRQLSTIREGKLAVKDHLALCMSTLSTTELIFMFKCYNRLYFNNMEIYLVIFRERMKHIYRSTHTHIKVAQMRSLVDDRFLIEVLALHGELLNGLLVDALEPPLALEAVLLPRLFLVLLDLDHLGLAAAVLVSRH